MCGENCGCGISHPHLHHRPQMDMAFPLSLMDVEEEVKMLEEYKEALTKRLEQVNKRIEALKR